MVAGPLLLIQRTMAMRLRMNEALGLRGLLPDHAALPTIGRVSSVSEFIGDGDIVREVSSGHVRPSLVEELSCPNCGRI